MPKFRTYLNIGLFPEDYKQWEDLQELSGLTNRTKEQFMFALEFILENRSQFREWLDKKMEERG